MIIAQTALLASSTVATKFNYYNGKGLKRCKLTF